MQLLKYIQNVIRKQRVDLGRPMTVSSFNNKSTLIYSTVNMTRNVAYTFVI